jgi:hypothetical protein
VRRSTWRVIQGLSWQEPTQVQIGTPSLRIDSRRSHKTTYFVCNEWKCVRTIPVRSHRHHIADTGCQIIYSRATPSSHTVHLRHWQPLRCDTRHREFKTGGAVRSWAKSRPWLGFPGPDRNVGMQSVQYLSLANRGGAMVTPSAKRTLGTSAKSRP